MSNKNLILAGFMGVGKSTVGRLCAQQLGYGFVDTDVEIERRAGQSIAQIFASQGEAHFRAYEAALVHELAQREKLVIATGGGMIVNDANRAALLRAGVCVALGASADEILARIGPNATALRPMLQGDAGPKARVAQLLRERAPKYAELHYTINTTGLTPVQVVDRVVGLIKKEHTRIAVNVPEGKRYDIVLGFGLLRSLGHMLAGRGYSRPCAVVGDENTAPLWSGRVLQALADAGLQGFVHTMPAGEAHKHLQSAAAMYAAFAAQGMERGSAVIALGGGVVGDVVGFAAATYLRGVPLIQVPTSLLAMADSSIGGKVGVDTAFGKNLVGAFKQPELVVIDLDCLQTLPAVELRCGLAEIIKAGLIKGGGDWDEVRSWGDDGMGRLSNTLPPQPLIASSLLKAIHLKREVVEEDPYENGRRALLNLGHTFGHGIEAWSQFDIKHGEAVSLGLVCALRASHQLGLCDGALVSDVMRVLQSVGLPTSLAAFPQLQARYDVAAIWQIMQSDKKKKGGQVRFVLIRQPGDCFVSDAVTPELALETLMSVRGSCGLC
jgi:3-dehydroquinate synthase